MKTFVCFGDSLTARKEGFEEPMLTTKLAKQLNQYEFINAGVSGDNTVDGLSRIEQDVIAHKPDGVTVLFGANDAAFHKSVPQISIKRICIKSWSVSVLRKPF